MLDDEFHIAREGKASLVSMVCPKFEHHKTEEESHHSLVELRELLRTLNIEAGEQYLQNRKEIDPAHILGKGKILEIAEAAKAEGSQILAFDFELTSSQIRNLKKLTDLFIIDRCHIILEIFAQNARTKDAKIQIEIARLQYILPRLSGFWSHLGRQRGGVGVMGGEGEQQIELDRRIIRDRIEHYKKELKILGKSRTEQRKRRQNEAVTAALVGYTNAGKSSLMNRLCKVDILEKDMLFATLDSTYRTLNPDTKPNMLLIDTVGFISNLPNTLIDGFKTTLESALEADLLLIVCDISDPNYQKHLKVTQEVLEEIGVHDKNQIIVFNKKDLLNDELKKQIIKRKHPNSFVISSFDEEDINKLREHVVNYFLAKQDHYDLFVPYEDGEAHSSIISKSNIQSQHNHEKGIFYRIRVPDFIFGKMGVQKFVLAPDDPMREHLE